MKKDKSLQFQVSRVMGMQKQYHKSGHLDYIITAPLTQVSNVNKLLIIISIKHTSELYSGGKKAVSIREEASSCMLLKLVP